MPLKQTTGSRAMVMHGTAKKTTGGLTKSQLKYNKQGKIVSKKASALAKKNNRLVKAGYITRKGEFGVSMRGGGEEWIMANGSTKQGTEGVEHTVRKMNGIKMDVYRKKGNNRETAWNPYTPAELKVIENNRAAKEAARDAARKRLEEAEKQRQLAKTVNQSRNTNSGNQSRTTNPSTIRNQNRARGAL